MKEPPHRLAQKVFNEWVRLRDSAEGCISCGTTKGTFHAGHYRDQAYNPGLRFNPINVNKQCRECNWTLRGNQYGYRKGLVEKYGETKVKELEQAYVVERWTDDQYLTIRDKYRKLVKELKRSRRSNHAIQEGTKREPGRKAEGQQRLAKRDKAQVHRASCAGLDRQSGGDGECRRSADDPSVAGQGATQPETEGH